MGDVIPVIVTGGGAPGIAGTIYSLRNNPDDTKYRIITTDLSADAAGQFLSDSFYKVPNPESPEYIPAILEICNKEKIRAIIPQTTREIIFLSKNVEIFQKSGIAVVVSSHNAIETTNDKYLLLKIAEQCGVPFPEYYKVDSIKALEASAIKLGYPDNDIIVKPRVSNGMRGLRILTERKWDVTRFLSEKPDGSEIRLDALIDILKEGKLPELLVTSYLPGDEYTADCFFDGSTFVSIPRKRDKIRSGITFEATVELRRDIMDFTKKLTEFSGLRYCFGFQFKLDENNIPKLLECNPRVQGTMVVSVFAGFNIIHYALKAALGESLSGDVVRINDGIKFKRYWGGIGIEKGKFIDRI